MQLYHSYLHNRSHFVSLILDAREMENMLFDGVAVTDALRCDREIDLVS